MHIAGKCFLVTLATFSASCARDNCDKSWLWGWDRADDLRSCAEKGNVLAQVRFGKLLYVNGHGSEGERWLTRATAGRGAKGAMDVARSFNGYNGDPRMAKVWFRRAYELGEPQAAVELGLLDHKDGNRDEANRWFERAVRKGGGWAANSIAFRLFRQQKDATAAAAWYKRGAEMGDHGSMSEFARFLQDGIGVPKNQTEAFRWRVETATHPQADGYDLLALAQSYDDGIGTKRDPRAALAAIRAAKGKWIDDSDTRTPRKMREMEERLKAELARDPA